MVERSIPGGQLRRQRQPGQDQGPENVLRPVELRARWTDRRHLYGYAWRRGHEDKNKEPGRPDRYRWIRSPNQVHSSQSNASGCEVRRLLSLEMYDDRRQSPHRTQLEDRNEWRRLPESGRLSRNDRRNHIHPDRRYILHEGLTRLSVLPAIAKGPRLRLRVLFFFSTFVSVSFKIFSIFVQTIDK